MKNLEFLEKKLAITFNNKEILTNVFIHRSYLNEHKHFYLTSNEKLEFLGDSVLSLVTSLYLYKNFPSLEEGEYTDIKAAIVRTESLASAAKSLGLGQFLFLSKGQDKEDGRHNQNILADCFEALIASIFIDQSFETAYQFVLKYLFADKLSHIIKNRLYLSPKSRLQEYTQSKFKSTPKYKIIEESGPEHERIFKVVVYIDGKKQALGIGKSKKSAEEEAARKTLENLL